MRILWTLGAALAFCIGFSAAGIHAQQASASAATRPGGDALDLSATSANVASPGIPVKIRILRWSTDAERMALIAALTTPPRPVGGAGGAGPARGGARGARGGAAGASAGAPPVNAQAGGRAGAAPAGGAAAGRAGAARAGGAPAGRAGRGALVQRVPLTPIEALAEAIGKAPTVGYIWTNDVTGYSIRYAWHAPANGGNRIVLVTDRRLDMYAPEWKPVEGTELADYQFTLIEIRTDAHGVASAKTSLTTKITFDKEANTLALDGFAGAPVLLRNIRHYQPRTTE